ncbi:MAG TPA: CPBP family intramembrane glutamic endopeptidase [Bacteroidota bacterium]|nr:CPBP family intramembrane glutamic endopeptidase [Bacteroidota bacterium]
MADIDPSGVPPQSESPDLPRREPFLRRIGPVPFTILALAVVFVLYQVVGGLITLLGLGFSQGEVSLENVALVRWATLLGQVLFILLPTLWLARQRHGELRSFFRIRVPETRELVATMIGVFALQQILQSYMMIQDLIPLPDELQKMVDMVRKLIEDTMLTLVRANSPGEFVLVLIVVALVPAVIEELLFRGLVQRNLEMAAGPWRGVLVTAVIFGAFHFNPFEIVPLVALGAYFGFIVYRADNITLAMSAHFFNNFVACAAVYLKLDDNFVAVAPAGRPTIALAMANFAVFALVFVAATLYFIQTTSRDEPDETL